VTPILRRSDCASDDDYLARMLQRYRRQGELFDRAIPQPPQKPPTAR